MNTAPSSWQQVALVALRVALGWHLFLQGYGKYISNTWTAKGYLAGATGPLAPWFRALAAEPRWLGVADQGTLWGLMALGSLLIVGLLSRVAALAGAALLMSFYLVAPPLASGPLTPTIDGTEWVVNKLLVEICGLLVVASFPTGRMAGLDLLWRGQSRDKTGGPKGA